VDRLAKRPPFGLKPTGARRTAGRGGEVNPKVTHTDRGEWPAARGRGAIREPTRAIRCDASEPPSGWHARVAAPSSWRPSGSSCWSTSKHRGSPDVHPCPALPGARAGVGPGRVAHLADAHPLAGGGTTAGVVPGSPAGSGTGPLPVLASRRGDRRGPSVR
jgi:hypothetical protein